MVDVRLFKTKKIALEYIHENYPNANLRSTSISEDANYDPRDMPNLCWSGETPAWEVEDKNLNTLAIVAWWEDGEDKYELFVGDDKPLAFDNSYDAREAYADALEEEKYEDEPREVKLFCNGEDISN